MFTIYLIPTALPVPAARRDQATEERNVNAFRWLAGAAALMTTRGLAAQGPDSSSNPVKISGYVTSSYFVATKPTGGAIVGRLYDRFHNQFTANAARITVEKTVATDKLDAGFRIDALFGQNAPPIRAAGLSLGDQGDLPQAFVTLNVPTGPGTYVQFKAGKMWTLYDVEVVDEVLNPNFSHGYAYIYLTDFTDTGFGIDTRLSAKVDAQLRLSNGWDVVKDNNKAKTVFGRLGIAPSERVGLAFLGYFGPEQTDNTSNNRYGAEVIGTFKPSGKATVYTQLDIGREEGLGPGGGDAKWWSAGVWTVFDLSPKAALALRGDYMDDRDGARTSGVLGFPVVARRTIGSATATVNLKTWDHVLLRPEFRFEHSNHDDFGGAGSQGPTQATFGVALSYVF